MRFVFFCIALLLFTPTVFAQERASKHERFERRVHSAEPTVDAEKPAPTEDVSSESSEIEDTPTTSDTHE